MQSSNLMGTSLIYLAGKSIATNSIEPSNKSIQRMAIATADF